MASGSTLGVRSGGIVTFGTSDDAMAWTRQNSVYVGKYSFLGGFGQIIGEVVVGEHARFGPGLVKAYSGPEHYGELSVDGDFSLLSGGMLSFEIGNGEFDSLSVSGNATLAGTVEAKFSDDFEWQDGMYFELFGYGGAFDATGATFSFSGDSLLPDDLMWYTSDSHVTVLREADLPDYLASTSSVPEACSFLIWCILGSFGLLSIRRR